MLCNNNSDLWAWGTSGEICWYINKQKQRRHHVSVLICCHFPFTNIPSLFSGLLFPCFVFCHYYLYYYLFMRPPFPYATPLCSLPLSFHMCVCCFHYSSCLYFSVYILSLCMPLTLFPLPLFCTHYFHSTACTTPHSLLPFLLPLLGYDCCFHLPLISTPFFLCHLLFLLYFVFVFIVISFIPFMPFCSILNSSPTDELGRRCLQSWWSWAML